jgi:hypothetical protein
MNQQAIAGILLLDEPELDSLRTSPEDLAEALGLDPVNIEALRKADRYVPRMDGTIELGTITITGHPPSTITMEPITITG